jgi:hypothetical protein
MMFAPVVPLAKSIYDTEDPMFNAAYPLSLVRPE